MTKFKKGDRVRIKTYAEIKKTLDKDDRDKKNNIGYNHDSMKRYCGKTYIVQYHSGIYYNLETEKGREVKYVWAHDWLEPATTKNPKFKVGDKVEIVDPSASGAPPTTKGKIGTIIEILRTRHTVKFTKKYNKGDIWFYQPESLKPYTPKKKTKKKKEFKVGDKVVFKTNRIYSGVITDDPYLTIIYIGKKGDMVEVTAMEDWCFVETKQSLPRALLGGKNGYYTHLSDLKHIDETTSTKKKKKTSTKKKKKTSAKKKKTSAKKKTKPQPIDISEIKVGDIVRVVDCDGYSSCTSAKDCGRNKGVKVIEVGKNYVDVDLGLPAHCTGGEAFELVKAKNKKKKKKKPEIHIGNKVKIKTKPEIEKAIAKGKCCDALDYGGTMSKYCGTVCTINEIIDDEAEKGHRLINFEETDHWNWCECWLEAVEPEPTQEPEPVREPDCDRDGHDFTTWTEGDKCQTCGKILGA